MINKIKIIKKRDNYSSELLYFLEKISDNSGFLFQDDKVVFIVKSSINDIANYSSSMLRLISNVKINAVEDNAEFVSGQYDCLYYTGSFDLDYFETFLELCRAYDQGKGTIYDFFFSISGLFKKDSQKNFDKLIGIFGELSLIKILYEKFKINISKNWHFKGDTTARYDFCFDDFNIEVKTTAKEQKIFKLKYDQFLSKRKTYFATCNVITDNSGESIYDLENYFLLNEHFNKNLDFIIKLKSELLSVQKEYAKEFHFNILDLKLYDRDNIEIFKEIPSSVSKIEFLYDFSTYVNSNLDEIARKIT